MPFISTCDASAEAVCCILLQYTVLQAVSVSLFSTREDVLHYSKLQHTATHCCSTLQHTDCNILQRIATNCHPHRNTHCITLEHTETTHSNALQHIPTYCITLQH